MNFYHKHKKTLQMMFPGFKEWAQFLIVGLSYEPSDYNFKKSMSGFAKEGHLRTGVWVNSIPENYTDRNIIICIYAYTEITQSNQYLFKNWMPKFICINVDYDGFIPQSDNMEDLQKEHKIYKIQNATIADLDYSAKLELKNIWDTFQDWSKFLIIGLNYDILDTIPILQQGTYGPDQSMNNFANLKWNNIKPNIFMRHLARYALYFPEKQEIIRNTIMNFNYMKPYLDDNYMEQYDWILENVNIVPIDPLIKKLISIGSFESYYLKIRSIIRNNDTSHLISLDKLEEHDPKLVSYYLKNVGEK